MISSHIFHANGRQVVIPCRVLREAGRPTIIIVHDEASVHVVASQFGGRVECDFDGWKITTSAVVPKGFVC